MVLEYAEFIKFLMNRDILQVGTIIDVLIDSVEKEAQEMEGPMPRFTCPLPCEYRYDIWRNVFVASMVLNFLLVIAIIPFLVSLIRSDVPEQLVRR